VAALLLLNLAGADMDSINLDYRLSRVGIEPAKKWLMSKLLNGMPINMDDPMVKAHADIPMDAMQKTLEAIVAKYGDVEGYVKKELGFSGEDVNVIHRNLTRRDL
jgi:hypothetical protein